MQSKDTNEFKWFISSFTLLHKCAPLRLHDMCLCSSVFRTSRFVTSGYLNFAIGHNRALVDVTE